MGAGTISNRAIAVLGLVVGFFYLATLSYQYPYDGIAWSVLLELQAARGTMRFESTHYLGFFALTQPLYRLVASFLELRGLVFLQVFDAACGGVAASLLAAWMRRRGFAPASLALGLIAFVTAPGWWTFCTTPEVYALGMVLCLGGLLLADDARASVREGRPRRAASASVLATLVPVLGHQSFGLVGVARILAARRRDGEDALRILAASVMGAVIFVLLAYAAHASSPEVTRPFASWILGYTEPRPGELVVEHWGKIQTIARGTVTRLPRELSDAAPLGWILLAAGAWGLITAGGMSDPAVRLLATFGLLHLGFCAAWDPEGNDAWAYVALPAAAGLARLAHSKPRTRPALALALAAGIAFTWSGRVGPAQDPGSNPYLARAVAIARETRPGEAILLPGVGTTWRDKTYVPYFAGRVPIYVDWALDTPASTPERLARLERVLANHRTRSPLVMTNALTDDTTVEESFRLRHGIDTGAWRAFMAPLAGPRRGPHVREVNTPSPAAP